MTEREKKDMDRQWNELLGRKRRKRHRGNGMLLVLLFLLLLALFVLLAPETMVSRLPSVLSGPIWNARQQISYRISGTEGSAADSRSIHDQLVQAVENHKSSVTIFCSSIDTVKEETENLLREPEYFWLGNQMEFVYSTGFCVVKLEMKYESIDEKAAEIEANAAEVLAQIPDGADDYLKALTIHDWLVENLQYSQQDAESDFDIYGALVKHQCVCDGYSKAFTYLLRKAGIESEIYDGDAENETASGPHSWNSAVLDGQLYYFDVTWDDPSGNSDGRVLHDWFGVTYDDMIASHHPDSGCQMPESNATACNYFRRNGYFLTSPDEQELREILSLREGCANILCSGDIAYAYLSSVLEEPQIFADLIGKTDSGLRYSYSLNDMRRTAYIQWE